MTDAIEDKGSVPKKKPPVRAVFRSVATPDQDIVSGHIIVVSRQPGLRRGGQEHGAVTVYARDAFTDEQFALLTNEPLLEVIEVK